MAEAIFGAWKTLGIRIVKWAGETMYIEVPSKPVSRENLCGADLAKRVQKMYPCTDPDSGKKNIVVKYKVYEPNE